MLLQVVASTLTKTIKIVSHLEKLYFPLVLGVPDTPEPPLPDRITKSSVTLSWRPPRDGGSKITGYIIQKKARGDADWSQAATIEAPSNLYTVSNRLTRKAQSKN